jgi:HlyD family secretion protein
VAASLPALIVGAIIVAVAGLSIYYLVRPQPLLVQGEVDATRLDIAARVDGRVAEVPVERGQNVTAGAVLVRIDNPETLAKHKQALAAKLVAEAQLANINVVHARKSLRPARRLTNGRRPAWSWRRRSMTACGPWPNTQCAAGASRSGYGCFA